MKKFLVFILFGVLPFLYPVPAFPDFNEPVQLLASDGTADDYFGWAVSLDGDYAIAGAWGDDDNGADSGAAYIFQRSGDTWVEMVKLISDDGAGGDYFGVSVAVSGDYAVVGAWADDDKGINSGSAYIFKRSGDTWNQMAKLTASDGKAYDNFGWSVSIDGDTVIVGSVYDDTNNIDSGSAYIFERSGDTWSQQAKLTASDGAYGDCLGVSVDISGDTAIAGSLYDDDDGNNSGAAYIFQRSGNTWSQQAKLTADDGNAYDVFGHFVSISGDTAIIGAPYDDDFGFDSGSAYIFQRSGSTWNQQAKLTADDGVYNDYFGAFVAIDGETAVVGAWADDDSVTDSGSAYVFQRSESTWTQKAKLTDRNGGQGDYFGSSVSVSGDTVIVAASYDDDNGNNSGSAFIITSQSAPDIPSQYAPYGSISETVFTWSIATGATSYSIWICDTSFTGVYFQTFNTTDVENSSYCSATIDPAYFHYGEVYYWYICASNNSGDAWSWNNGGMAFWLSSSLDLPEIPTQYSPSGATENTTFTWSISPNATSYSIWICDAAFSGVYFQTFNTIDVEGDSYCSTTIDASYFTDDQGYYWYICASNSAGDAWSWNNGGVAFWLPSSFDLPETPTQYSPSGATENTTFTWSASSGATNYEIWIGDDLNTAVFYGNYEASEVENGQTCSTTIDQSYFIIGEIYRWYVGASNSSGSSWTWNSGGMSFYLTDQDDPDDPDH